MAFQFRFYPLQSQMILCSKVLLVRRESELVRLFVR
ncbi:hypothetical protein SAMN06265361_103303 [Laceyella tengchongensis]|uniref:Uncharacterized protein n=1 Tax=Laceyella tengchongensis TaxID=574699 RepID=A0AA46AFH6_9BACL|nr:hypothetical protein SAMN06265361_103303 [Laceyella tengchongensis]